MAFKGTHEVKYRFNKAIETEELPTMQFRVLTVIMELIEDGEIPTASLVVARLGITRSATVLAIFKALSKKGFIYVADDGDVTVLKDIIN